MTDAERDTLRGVIHRFGFLDPLTVRPHGAVGKYQIIDGENRWEVGVEEGMVAFPCWLIEVDDDTAMMLTPILNELHGTADVNKLGELLKDLQSRHPEAMLREIMPFDRGRFDELIGKISVDWDQLDQKRKTDAEERWVERVYRMPADAAGVVDQAVAKARAEADAEQDWRGLEFVCAEFLGR